MITNNAGRNFLGAAGVRKVACVIVYTDFRFEMLARCTERSFKKFHPDVDTFMVTPESLPLFPNACISFYSGMSWGIGALKYIIARDLMLSLGYTKVICLGADTIVCAPLTEFMEDDESHIITSADSNLQLKLPLDQARLETFDEVVPGSGRYGVREYWISPYVRRDTSVTHEDVKNGVLFEHLPPNTFAGAPPEGSEDEYDSMHLNADVVCFNADPIEVLRDPKGRHWAWDRNFVFLFACLQQMIAEIHGTRSNIYKEQGLINTMLYVGADVKELYLPYKAFQVMEPDCIEEQRQKLYDMWINADWNLTVVDLPYDTSNALYNIRSLYENDKDLSREQVYERAKQFYVDDDKLYNRHGKQIKVFHLRDSLIRLPLSKWGERLEEWKIHFQQNVKDFLSESCGCKEFFETDLVEWYADATVAANETLGGSLVARHQEILEKHQEEFTKTVEKRKIND